MNGSPKNYSQEEMRLMGIPYPACWQCSQYFKAMNMLRSDQDDLEAWISGQWYLHAYSPNDSSCKTNYMTYHGFSPIKGDDLA